MIQEPYEDVEKPTDEYVKDLGRYTHTLAGELAVIHNEDNEEEFITSSRIVNVDDMR